MPPLRAPPNMLPFLLSLSILFCVVSVSSAETAASDLAALQALAKSLGADQSASLHWTGLDPCTNWVGMTCSADGHVTALQLGNRNLVGSLSPTVGNLTFLTRLELQGNSLTGPLPDISALSSLQVLLLHSNNFSSIPSNFFSGLSSLQVVALDDNPFASWVIPDSLSSASSLVNFSAVNTNLAGSLPEFLATSFPSFQHFALSFNFLTGSVPDSFASSPLRSLWLNSQKGTTRFTGDIAFLSNMTSLEQVWLHSNDFSGPLPDFSGLVSLTDLELRDNSFTGPVPESLIGLKSLKILNLTNNLLQGPMPSFASSVKLDMDSEGESFCLSTPGPCDSRVTQLLSVVSGFGYPTRFAQSWKGNDPCGNSWIGITCDASGNITVINFQKMDLNGSISPDFAKITTLQRLLLAHNNITGKIPPELTGLMGLKVLDVSNNSLWGEVPNFNKNILVNTAGNTNIGKDQPAPSSTATNSTTNPSTGKDNGSGSNPNGSSNTKPKSISIGATIGILLASLACVSLVGLLGFYCYKRKIQPLGRVQSPNAATVIHPRHSGSDPDTVKVTVAGPHLNGLPGLSSDSHTSSGPSTSDVHVVETGNMVISIQVLRNVTNNFSSENILGRGGFGTVYKGELHDGTKIAVKRMEAGVMGNKGLNEFRSEISVLTKVRHRNLVSLLGYCLDGNERILVYEYMPQGAVSKHLFDWREEDLKPLEWKKRLSIALDVARGVEYLHSLAHQSFIHRDLKPSNILLGDDMKAKVADFGLVRLVPADGKCCSVETRLAGTFGYLAPEYAVTGRVTTKSDVFSFGVILMELITGRKALDETQPEESMHLVTWFRRMQITSAKDLVHQLADPSLSPLDEETLASLATVAELAGHCCAREPHQRPDMGHAVNVLSSLAESWKPSDQDSDDSYGIDLDMTLPQALKKWQAFEDSQLDGATSSFLASLDNTQTSIPTRPPGFAESFTSADGR